MIESLSKILVSWQISKGYLHKEKESLYTYAYELLIGQAINLLIACFLAFIFHSYMTVFVYLISYIPLRSYAGGHHADTYFACTIVSAGLICAACIAVRAVPSEYILRVNLSGACVGGFIIFLLAPVQDYNKPLDQEERVRYRRRSRVIWLIETALWIVCLMAGARTISLTIVFAHITLSLLLCLGILKNKYRMSRCQKNRI